MINRLSILAVTALLVAPVMAQTSAQYTPAKPAKRKLVCVNDTSTGTRIAQQTCLYEDEWKALDDKEAVAGRKFIDQAVAVSALNKQGSPN